MTLEHDAVRETLIAATLTLMDEGGLDAVKARPLAQAVGVSVGTVYNLFGSVDGLVLAANQRIYADLAAIGMQSVARIEVNLARRIGEGALADTPRNRARERLLGLAEVYIDFVAANANRWSALLAFNRSRSAALASETYMAQLDALIDIIGRVLAGSPRCADPVLCRKTARTLWSAVHGIVTMNYFGGAEETARARTWELLTILVEAFVDGLFAPETA